MFERDLSKAPDCSPLLREAKALGIKKLTAMFCGLIVLSMVSALILVAEIISPPKLSQKKITISMDSLPENVKTAIHYLKYQYKSESLYLEDAWKKIR